MTLKGFMVRSGEVWNGRAGCGAVKYDAMRYGELRSGMAKRNGAPKSPVVAELVCLLPKELGVVAG